jgi:1-acyl-sn-glycerol-3-phosphate acyltransferase
MNEPVPVDDRPAAPLWRNVNFTLMWTSVAASGFGDRLIMLIGLALMGVSQNLSAKASLSAAIYFWFHLPYLILSPPGGWLADTFPRKWVMALCDESRAAVLLFAFLIIPATGAAALPPEARWTILGLIAVVGCFAAIFNPVRNAAVPQLVPLRQLPAANGVIISIATIASLIGLVIGEMMIDEQHAATLRTCLLMAIGFYFVSGIMLLFLRLAKKRAVADSADRGFRRVFAALGYMKNHPRTLALTGANMLVWGAAMIVSNVFIALSEQRYGFAADRSLAVMAQMTALLGAGMLAGGLFSAWMNTRRESIPIGMAALCAAGVSVVLLPFNPFYPVGLALAFAIGFCGNVTIISTFSLLMAISPNYIRGRVMGINSFATTLSIIVVNFIIMTLPGAAADKVMVDSLPPTGLVLMTVGAYGLHRSLWRGPMKEWNRNFFWHLDRIFMLVWHRVQWFGRENIPSTGAVILASNHTAGIDPFLIQAGLLRRVRWVMMMKNFYKVLTPLWKTIDPIVLEKGKAPLRQLKTVIDSLDSGEVAGIFPEGGLQRDKRELKPFQSGIGMIAVRSGAKIVPVWIAGTPVSRSMVWHFLWPSRSRVYFGKAYLPDKGKSYEAIVEELREKMIVLAQAAENT